MSNFGIYEGPTHRSFQTACSQFKTATHCAHFDLFTFTVFVPELSRITDVDHPHVLHELVHFLQFAATPAGQMINHLNMNIVNAGVRIVAVLNGRQEPLRMPLLAYALHVARKGAALRSKLAPHIQMILRSTQALDRLLRPTPASFALPDMPRSVEIDRVRRSLVIDGQKALPIGLECIVESMAYLTDVRLLNRGTLSWRLPVSPSTAHYYLPWLSIALHGDNGGIPYYLSAMSWLALFVHPASAFDALGYDHGPMRGTDMASETFADFLSIGSKAAPIFERLVDNDMDNPDCVFDALDETCRQVNFTPPRLKELVESELRSAQVTVKCYETLDPIGRNGLNLLLARIRASFFSRALQHSLLLCAPHAFFEDPAVARPFIWYRDGVTWPTELPSIGAWTVRQRLWRKLLWGTSLECYDSGYSSRFDNAGAYYDCPDHVRCRQAITRVGIGFCGHMAYRREVDLFLEELDWITTERIDAHNHELELLRRKHSEEMGL